MHDCLPVRPVKDCPELLRSLPLFSDDSFGTRPGGGIHALFSVLMGRHFSPGSVPASCNHARSSKDKEIPLGLRLRPAAPLLVLTLIAVATLLLRL